MKLRIRIADVGDSEASCEVVRRSIIECCNEDHRGDTSMLAVWLANKTPDNFRAWIQASGVAVVAEVDDLIAGFAMSSPAGEIMLCYIAPEVRFLGVGKALLDAIEARAAASGIETLRLHSTRTARPFYLRNGFKPSGPATMSFGIEGHPMTKRLADDAGRT